MKKSILTLAIFALSFTNSIANETTTTTTTNSNRTETTPIVSRDQITKVYTWNVKTAQRNYSGTDNSLEEANKMIALVTTGEVVLDKKVESFYQVINQEESNNKLYFWEAQTTSGHAKGFSNSKEQAMKMIELIKKGDVISFKIIQSINY